MYKRLLYLSGIFIVIVATLVLWWNHRWKKYVPSDAYHDVVAAMKVGNAEKPVERFLNLRYGEMENAENRQRAFIEFFNVDHVEGLYIIVNRLSPEDQRDRIMEMAQWVAQYRKQMSDSERQSLKAYFESEEGKKAVREARIQYMEKDYRFRADTSPVIYELMKALYFIQNP